MPADLKYLVPQAPMIMSFRWHALRHHFASRLVQRGVPPNSVHDLLGHSCVGMSLHYAHLAPDPRQEAVAKLNEMPILTLTMRLPWNAFQAPCTIRLN
jgi:site-specific recombinase XerD